MWVNALLGQCAYMLSQLLLNPRLSFSSASAKNVYECVCVCLCACLFVFVHMPKQMRHIYLYNK